MRFLTGIFGFLKMPLQIAIGLYFAFIMLVGTIAILDQFGDNDYCEDLEFLVDYKSIDSGFKVSASL